MLRNPYFWKLTRVFVCLPFLVITILSWKSYTSMREFAVNPHNDAIDGTVAYPIIILISVICYLYVGCKAMSLSKKKTNR